MPVLRMKTNVQIEGEYFAAGQIVDVPEDHILNSLTHFATADVDLPDPPNIVDGDYEGVFNSEPTAPSHVDAPGLGSDDED